MRLSTASAALIAFAGLLAAGCTKSAPAAPGVARVWHGKVSSNKADDYAKYLGDAIKKFRAIPGNLGYQMMREDAGAETHFMVVSYWTTLDAIHGYAGADISKTHFLPRDMEFLIEPEPNVHNYSLLVEARGE